MKKEIPVYLFTGFLEGGKTRVLQESMSDPNFNSGEKTLILQCEEGEEELDSSRFCEKDVPIVTVENASELTEEFFIGLRNQYHFDRMMVEYNGMWLINTLYQALPENWPVYQEMMFADATTFQTYNSNMRQLMVDKLQGAEMIVVNRTSETTDKMAIHKIIRAISRRTAIIFDYPDGHIENDTVEDPLPFDKNAPVIEIADRDFALWYQDLVESLNDYNGKTVRFKGVVAADPRMGPNTVMIGRHVMKCCAADISYNGLLCVFPKPHTLKTKDWITVTAKIKVENHKLYRDRGPVLYEIKTDFAVPLTGDDEVATFY